GEKKYLLLVGKVADGKADIGEERAGEHRDVLARHQLVGGGLRIGRLAAVVLGDHDQLLAIDAAGGVDLLHGKLPALAVRLGEGRQGRVAVDLADLDFALRHGVAGQTGNDDRKSSAQQMSPSHPFSSTALKIYLPQPVFTLNLGNRQPADARQRSA